MLTNVFRQSNARTSCLRRSSSRNPEQLDSSRIRRVPETRPGYKAGADISRTLPRTESLVARPAAAQTPNHREDQRQTVAHFAKPARTPRQKRAEGPKTIPKTVRKTVQKLNKGPNFRMVDTYGTPFLFEIGRASCRER